MTLTDKNGACAFSGKTLTSNSGKSKQDWIESSMVYSADILEQLESWLGMDFPELALVEKSMKQVNVSRGKIQSIFPEIIH